MFSIKEVVREWMETNRISPSGIESLIIAISAEERAMRTGQYNDETKIFDTQGGPGLFSTSGTV
jgi:hypothetical protein